jgi:hypothetical protein
LTGLLSAQTPIHLAELLGYQPTGRHVWWYGTPFFTFDGAKVRDLWVLGEQQMT